LCGGSGELLEFLSGDPAPFGVPMRRLRDVAIDLSRQLHATDRARPLFVESLALELMARALRLVEVRPHAAKPPACLAEAKALIERHLDRPLTTTMVARSLRVTPRQLAAAFRVEGTTTFHRYVRERRVARAVSLLQDRDLPLADIALVTGFSDQSHFVRVFREAMGTTPGRFRRQSGTCAGESF
ncbi:MAG TPA: AraC family transcriptional regulator, partial [Thermoanaerobaculia bacterium]|nr:AraC family transcriptional regulator [Thermoanaerobaculia bacterium]